MKHACLDPMEQWLLDHGWEMSWGMWRRGVMLLSDKDLAALTMDQLQLLITPTKEIM